MRIVTRMIRGREIAGLSIGQAASMLGLLPSTLEIIETSLPSDPLPDARVLSDMAELYQTSVAWLLEWSQPQ